MFTPNIGTCLRIGLAPAEVVGENGPGEAEENTLSAAHDPLSDVFKDEASDTLFFRR